MSDSSLTREAVLELFDYDRAAGELYWRTPRSRAVKKGQRAGCYVPSGHRQVQIGDKVFGLHRLIWLIETGQFPQENLDHINRVPDDNRFCNLRELPPKQNSRNRRKSRNNTTGVTGVFWHKRVGKYQANIRVDDKLVHLGYFESFEDAVRARKLAEQRFGFFQGHGT